MEPAEYAAAVAAEVRAEMGRQRKTRAELAAALGMTTATATRRLEGSAPFDVMELAIVAQWLDVPTERLTPLNTEAAAS